MSFDFVNYLAENKVIRITMCCNFCDERGSGR